MNNLPQQRKSHLETGLIYFWTASINNWYPLLADDYNKNIILDCLRYLSEKKKIEVYAFVIMPTHIHFIWKEVERNGKESAHTSFMKFTAHAFQKRIRATDSCLQSFYSVCAHNKRYEFWQRDALAVELYTRTVAFQKLEYIHNNPVAKKWSLTATAYDYPYSSVRFYETGVDEFGFLKHLGEVL